MLMNMKLNPSVILFWFVLIGGTMITLVSPSIVGAWFGMEVNLFAAIPLFCGKSGFESVSCVKYFVFQALGSGFIFLSLLIALGVGWVLGLGYEGFFVSVLMIIGMSLKIGLFPCHLWVPEVISGLSWMNCFLLMVVQKVAPIWVISGIGVGGLYVLMLMLVSCLTSFFGSLGGLSQVSLRCLLAYSSLVHSGWIVIVSLISSLVFVGYMVIYSFILGGLVYSLEMEGLVSMYDWSGFSGLGELNSCWIWIGLYFLSLGGIPPLSGMVAKVLSIIILCGVQPMFLFMLIVASLISLYFYLGVFFSLYLSFGGVGMFGKFLLMNNSNKWHLVMSVMINFFLGPLVVCLGMWFLLL